MGRNPSAQRSCGWSGWGGEGSAITRSEPTQPGNRIGGQWPAAAFRAAQAGVRGLQVPRWDAGWPEALSGPRGGLGGRPSHSAVARPTQGQGTA